MRNIYNAIKQLFSNKVNLLIFVLVSLGLTALYFFIIEKTVTLNSFFRVNAQVYIILQLILTVLNSVLGGLTITLLIRTLRIKQNEKNTLSVFEIIGSVGISIFTTGCYICGSLILPIAGLTTFLATLPLAGIEIKLFTILLLLFSLQDLSKKFLGICEIEKDKIISIKYGDRRMSFNTKYIYKLKTIFILLGFVGIISLLSITLPKKFINNTNSYSCPRAQMNN